MSIYSHPEVYSFCIRTAFRQHGWLNVCLYITALVETGCLPVIQALPWARLLLFLGVHVWVGDSSTVCSSWKNHFSLCLTSLTRGVVLERWPFAPTAFQPASIEVLCGGVVNSLTLWPTITRGGVGLTRLLFIYALRCAPVEALLGLLFSYIIVGVKAKSFISLWCGVSLSSLRYHHTSWCHHVLPSPTLSLCHHVLPSPTLSLCHTSLHIFNWSEPQWWGEEGTP